jgi:hypothetical protein
VYVDSSVIMGMTGDYNAGSTGFDGIQYMPCSPDNDFFPDLSKVPVAHLALLTLTPTDHRCTHYRGITLINS